MAASHEVRDGLLEAYVRREKKAALRASLVALAVTFLVLVLYAYLVRQIFDLEKENAKFRDECGIKGRDLKGPVR